MCDKVTWLCPPISLGRDALGIIGVGTDGLLTDDVGSFVNVTVEVVLVNFSTLWVEVFSLGSVGLVTVGFGQVFHEFFYHHLAWHLCMCIVSFQILDRLVK